MATRGSGERGKGGRQGRQTRKPNRNNGAKAQTACKCRMMEIHERMKTQKGKSVFCKNMRLKTDRLDFCLDTPAPFTAVIPRSPPRSCLCAAHGACTRISAAENPSSAGLGNKMLLLMPLSLQHSSSLCCDVSALL